MGRARPLELLQGRARGRHAVSPVCWGEPETWESDLLGRYKWGDGSKTLPLSKTCFPRL